MVVKKKNTPFRDGPGGGGIWDMNEMKHYLSPPEHTNPHPRTYF